MCPHLSIKIERAKTIFLTGASSGFGKLWAEAFLRRGDKVAATSRNVAGLQDLADTYGAALHSNIKKYGFFEYEVNEALHLAPHKEHIICSLCH